MVVRLIFILAGILFGLASALADGVSLPLCPGSSKVAAADPLLRSALKAAYPRAVERKGRARTSEPCLYPYQAILYETSVVLITLGQIPGEGCHGCGAKVSATFLRKEGAALTPVGRHADFAEVGTFAAPSAITPVRFGADDGVVIEGGGTFQGVSFSVIEPFVFRTGRARPIGPENGIPLAYEDCGAKVDEPCASIGGQWRADPGGRLLVAYSGRRADKTNVEATAVYERRGDALVLVSGAKVAAEMSGMRP
ncbi:MAG TPA: hypothetical protein VEZ16_00355 [Microvirga sp.]|nr:hypothetical protein [Microvirga sp.]